jgi:hypothetical protein
MKRLFLTAVFFVLPLLVLQAWGLFEPRAAFGAICPCDAPPECGSRPPSCAPEELQSLIPPYEEYFLPVQMESVYVQTKDFLKPGQPLIYAKTLVFHEEQKIVMNRAAVGHVSYKEAGRETHLGKASWLYDAIEKRLSVSIAATHDSKGSSFRVVTTDGVTLKTVDLETGAFLAEYVLAQGTHF